MDPASSSGGTSPTSDFMAKFLAKLELRERKEQDIIDGKSNPPPRRSSIVVQQKQQQTFQQQQQQSTQQQQHQKQTQQQQGTTRRAPPAAPADQTMSTGGRVSNTTTMIIAGSKQNASSSSGGDLGNLSTRLSGLMVPDTFKLQTPTPPTASSMTTTTATTMDGGPALLHPQNRRASFSLLLRGGGNGNVLETQELASSQAQAFSTDSFPIRGRSSSISSQQAIQQHSSSSSSSSLKETLSPGSVASVSDAQEQYHESRSRHLQLQQQSLLQKSMQGRNNSTTNDEDNYDNSTRSGGYRGSYSSSSVVVAPTISNLLRLGAPTLAAELLGTATTNKSNIYNSNTDSGNFSSSSSASDQSGLFSPSHGVDYPADEDEEGDGNNYSGHSIPHKNNNYNNNNNPTLKSFSSTSSGGNSSLYTAIDTTTATAIANAAASSVSPFPRPRASTSSSFASTTPPISSSGVGASNSISFQQQQQYNDNSYHTNHPAKNDPNFDYASSSSSSVAAATLTSNVQQHHNAILTGGAPLTLAEYHHVVQERDKANEQVKSLLSTLKAVNEEASRTQRAHSTIARELDAAHTKAEDAAANATYLQQALYTVQSTAATEGIRLSQRIRELEVEVDAERKRADEATAAVRAETANDLDLLRLERDKMALGKEVISLQSRIQELRAALDAAQSQNDDQERALMDGSLHALNERILIVSQERDDALASLQATRDGHSRQQQAIQSTIVDLQKSLAGQSQKVSSLKEALALMTEEKQRLDAEVDEAKNDALEAAERAVAAEEMIDAMKRAKEAEELKAAEEAAERRRTEGLQGPPSTVPAADFAVLTEYATRMEAQCARVSRESAALRIAFLLQRITGRRMKYALETLYAHACDVQEDNEGEQEGDVQQNGGAGPRARHVDRRGASSTAFAAAFEEDASEDGQGQYMASTRNNNGNSNSSSSSRHQQNGDDDDEYDEYDEEGNLAARSSLSPSASASASSPGSLSLMRLEQIAATPIVPFGKKAMTINTASQVAASTISTSQKPANNATFRRPIRQHTRPSSLMLPATTAAFAAATGLVGDNGPIHDIETDLADVASLARSLQSEGRGGFTAGTSSIPIQVLAKYGQQLSSLVTRTRTHVQAARLAARQANLAALRGGNVGGEAGGDMSNSIFGVSTSNNNHHHLNANATTTNGHGTTQSSSSSNETGIADTLTAEIERSAEAHDRLRASLQASTERAERAETDASLSRRDCAEMRVRLQALYASASHLLIALGSPSTLTLTSKQQQQQQQQNNNNNNGSGLTSPRRTTSSSNATINDMFTIGNDFLDSLDPLSPITKSSLSILGAGMASPAAADNKNSRNSKNPETPSSSSSSSLADASTDTLAAHGTPLVTPEALSLAAAQVMHARTQLDALRSLVISIIPAASSLNSVDLQASTVPGAQGGKQSSSTAFQSLDAPTKQAVALAYATAGSATLKSAIARVESALTSALPEIAALTANVTKATTTPTNGKGRSPTSSSSPAALTTATTAVTAITSAKVDEYSSRMRNLTLALLSEMDKLRASEASSETFRNAREDADTAARETARALADLRAQLAVTKRSMTKAEAEVATLRHALGSAQAERDAAQADTQASRAETVRAKEEIDALRGKIRETLAAAREQFRAETTALARERTELAARASAAEGALQEALSSSASIRQASAEVHEGRLAALKECDRLRRELEAEKADSAIRAQVVSSEWEQRLESSTAALRDDYEAMLSATKAGKEEEVRRAIQEAEATMTNLASLSMSEIQKEREAHQHQLDALRNAHEYATSELMNGCEQRIIALNAELEQTRRQVEETRQEAMRYQNMAIDNDALRDKISALAAADSAAKNQLDSMQADAEALRVRAAALTETLDSVTNELERQNYDNIRLQSQMDELLAAHEEEMEAVRQESQFAVQAAEDRAEAMVSKSQAQARISSSSSSAAAAAAASGSSSSGVAPVGSSASLGSSNDSNSYSNSSSASGHSSLKTSGSHISFGSTTIIRNQ